jgi:hypothetical protein
VKGTGTGVVIAPEAIKTGQIKVNPPTFGDDALTIEEKALLVGEAIPEMNMNPLKGKFNTTQKNDIVVYYTTTVSFRQLAQTVYVRGWAFSSDGYRNMKTVDLNDSIVIPNMGDYYTLAHELYHILGQTGHYQQNNPWNLFNSPTTTLLIDKDPAVGPLPWMFQATVFDSRRLFKEEAKTAKETKSPDANTATDKPYAEDPPQ